MYQSQFIEMFGGDKYAKVLLGDYTDLTWGDTNTTKNSFVSNGYLAYSASGPDGMLDHFDFEREGIILSAIGADCGKTWFATGKWSCIKNTIRFWSVSEKLDNRFLYFATREKDFWPRRGGAQPFIPQGEARNCSIPLPPLSLQFSFVEIAEQADKSKFSGLKSQFIEMFKDAPIVKLGEHIDTQSGGTPNTKKTEYYEGGDIPWLSSGEVNQGYINGTEKYITKAGLDNSSAKWSPEHSIVIAMYGATAGKVGYLNIPVTTNQAVCTLLPSSSFVPKFLYYAVSNKSSWMVSQCQGAAQPNISQGIIRKMEIPMPEKSLQREFVLIVEQADKSKFSGLKSQFIEMFGQSSLDNGIIGDYLLLKAGKAMPADRISSSKADGMFPCFGGNGIRGYVDSYNYDGDYAIIGRQGALCGNVCLAQGKFYATEHAIVVTPKAIVDSTWLFFALNQMNLNQYARGVAQPGLAVNELEKLPFSVPDISKQIEFSIIAQQADKSKQIAFSRAS